MNMRIATLSMACAVSIAPSLMGQAPFVMHKHQTGPWYSNNFGASAQDHFPTVKASAFAQEAADGKQTGPVRLLRDDIDVLFSGRIRYEAQLFNRPLTLRDDYMDMYGFTRSKLNLECTSQYGRNSYGKPAAQMRMRMTAFYLWADPYVYTPVLSEKVYVDGTNFLRRAELDSHTHNGVVPLIFLEEGWVRVNFDSFMEGLTVPVALQVGAFPFIVGRGVSLGNYFEGGVEAFGFERKGDIGNVPLQPVGVLVSIGSGEHTTIEFYYSKWQKRSDGPDWTREPVKAKRLDRDDNTDPRSIERGFNSDTDIFAARVGFNVAPLEDHTFYLEPYGVFLNAPELKVEFDADSSLRQGTVGVMAEYSSGGWSVNVEVAGQYGQQNMFPIDRNHLVVADAYYTETATQFDGNIPQFSAVAGRLDKQIGQPTKYYSHIFLGVTNPTTEVSEYLPYSAYYVSDEIRDINANRAVTEQGARILKDDPETQDNDDPTTHIAGQVYQSKKFTYNTDAGHPPAYQNASLYNQYQFETGISYYDTVFGLLGTTPDGTLFNANLPFGALRRFRNGYHVTNTGAMLMIDARYVFPDERVNVSFAGGYIGGCAYPFTTDEKDKQTRHFMPLRDANYVGRYVTSFVMFYPRKLPRPMDMADNDLFASNNYKTLQNLQYLGASFQWYPDDSGTVLLEGNAIYFWEVVPPHVWDVKATRTFPDNSAPGKEDSIYAYVQSEQAHFAGAATTQLASKNLGLELNMILSWRPYKSLQFDLRAGIFVPGQLYTDVIGCPNINTRRIDEKGNWYYDSLGDAMISGMQGRVTYRF